MFGLTPEELAAVATVAGVALGALVRISIQCGRILEGVRYLRAGMHDHEARIRETERRLGIPPAPLPPLNAVVKR